MAAPGEDPDTLGFDMNGEALAIRDDLIARPLCRAGDIEHRQTSKGLTTLLLHQLGDYFTIFYYKLLYQGRIEIAKKESNLQKKRTIPIMIFDNVEFD